MKSSSPLTSDIINLSIITIVTGFIIESSSSSNFNRWLPHHHLSRTIQRAPTAGDIKLLTSINTCQILTFVHGHNRLPKKGNYFWGGRFRKFAYNSSKPSMSNSNIFVIFLQDHLSQASFSKISTINKYTPKLSTLAIFVHSRRYKSDFGIIQEHKIRY